MMTLKNGSRGFTLIELLVVITIIGILATGATATYTSQIQKARDTTRINDVKALQSGVEQSYQDASQYPDATAAFSGVTTYLPKLPKDPKNGQTCNKNGADVQPICLYVYGSSDDNNGISRGEYKITTAFENTGNITGKATTDGGTDKQRYELGLDLLDGSNHLASCNADAAITSSVVPYGAIAKNKAADNDCAVAAAPVAGAGGHSDTISIAISGNE